jgi:hypothetical protein
LQAWRNQEFDDEKTRHQSAFAAAKMASAATVNRDLKMKKSKVARRHQEKNPTKRELFSRIRADTTYWQRTEFSFPGFFSDIDYSDFCEVF